MNLTVCFEFRGGGRNFKSIFAILMRRRVAGIFFSRMGRVRLSLFCIGCRFLCQPTAYPVKVDLDFLV
jgi:hypothetical protein